MRSVPELVAAIRSIQYELVMAMQDPRYEPRVRFSNPGAIAAYFQALVRIGRPALAPLIRGLGHDDDVSTDVVIWAIQQIYPSALPDDSSLLIAMKRDGRLSSDVRDAAAEALRRLQPKLPALPEWYEDPIDINW